MKPIQLLLFSLTMVIMVACQGSTPEMETTKRVNDPLSPHRIAMANFGATHVHIEYNSPSVRERAIWGDLVPYDSLWVTGAHTATFIHFYGDVVIANDTIREGKYGLFSIPGRDQWTLILNTNWDQHLTDEYDITEDVLRWTVTPETIDFMEPLTYVVNPKDSTVSIKWETLKVSFKVYPIDAKP
jgi:hypothetical protein